MSELIRRILPAVAAVAVLGGAATVACSSSSASPAAVDAGVDDDSGGGSVGPDAASSFCGHPGDQGNTFGVGKFCTSSNDCSANAKAQLCAIIGDDHSFFCTFICQKDGSADQCGPSAHCADQGGPAGCLPDICDPPPDAGADADIADAEDAG